MGSSIQDYLRKINSKISLLDIVSLLGTLVFLACFCIYLKTLKASHHTPVIYKTRTFEQSGSSMGSQSTSLPFGSKSGKTYTFNWCRGSAKIKESNKIYFRSEEEARLSGRTLSKLCK